MTRRLPAWSGPTAAVLLALAVGVAIGIAIAPMPHPLVIQFCPAPEVRL